jgi:uncharacterized SAM-binding protein YcdF (DUF218 family)
MPTLNFNFQKLTSTAKQVFRRLIKFFGWVLFVAILLSFTDIPFKAYYWLGTSGADLTRKPDYIVLLGGVGMPSPEDLIRIYTVAGAWKQVPDAKVIIAFPNDTAKQQFSPELMMASELIMRGVDSSMILFEKEGISTRTQAENISEMFDLNSIDTIGIRIVTSPEHMFRAVRTFRKIGFKYVGGTPAFESVVDENKLIRGKKKYSEKKLQNIRYNMWSYLKYEITVVREFCAICYYKLRGWI